MHRFSPSLLTKMGGGKSILYTQSKGCRCYPFIAVLTRREQCNNHASIRLCKCYKMIEGQDFFSFLSRKITSPKKIESGENPGHKAYSITMSSTFVLSSNFKFKLRQNFLTFEGERCPCGEVHLREQ